MQSGSATVARQRAQHARKELIDLTYQLPRETPTHVLILWNAADDALRNFILALQELEQ